MSALGLFGALLVHNGNVDGQSVDDPFKFASVGEIESDPLELEGPLIESPVLAAAESLPSSDPSQVQRQSDDPLRSVVESPAPRAAFNPFSTPTSATLETSNPLGQAELVKPMTESKWRANEPADVVPQLNSPQLNSPSSVPSAQIPAPSLAPPTMTAPRSLNYDPTLNFDPFPRNPQSSIPRFAPRTCEDDFDCPYNRARRPELDRPSGYLPYGGLSRYEPLDNGYWSGYGRDRQPEFRGYDRREDQLLDEIYRTRRPVMLVPMSGAPICPYGNRY